MEKKFKKLIQKYTLITVCDENQLLSEDLFIDSLSFILLINDIEHKYHIEFDLTLLSEKQDISVKDLYFLAMEG